MTEATIHWQTAELPADDRHSAWQDMLNRAYGSWNLAPARGMDALVASRATGSLQFVDCVCDPCSARRSRADVRRDARETLTIQLVLSGREEFTIDDRRLEL